MLTCDICKSIFLSFLVILINCAPVPMIQSARVTGRAGLGFDYSSESYYVEYKDRDTIPPEYPDTAFLGLQNNDDVYQGIGARAYLRFSIKNRVEFMVTAIPNLYQPYGKPPVVACGNVKVALFDVGTEKLFHNISGAVFAGGTFFPWEMWDYYDQWCGFITGTHTVIKSIDIEFVVMTSLSHFQYYTFFDCCGTKDMRFLIINLSPGAIVRPFKRHWLEMNLGCALRIPVNSYAGAIDNDHELVSSELVKYKINPLVFQGGMLIYLPDKNKK